MTSPPARSTLPAGSAAIIARPRDVDIELAVDEKVPANTWSSAGSLPSVLIGFSTTLLPNGQVLAAGGTGSTGTASGLPNAELFTPTSDPTARQRFPQPRAIAPRS